MATTMKITKARKPTNCYECTKPISAGENYLKYSRGFGVYCQVCLSCAKTLPRYTQSAS